MYFAVFDVQLFHLSQLLLTVHMCVCAWSHTDTVFSSWRSLSVQVACNPWYQQTDVRAKYSVSCHGSLSEDRLILHSFMNKAVFKVVSF